MAVPARIRDAIVDGRSHADGSIYAAYKWLRDNDPVGLIKADGYDPFRVVTRYADVQQVSRDNVLFTNNPQSMFVTQAEQATFEAEGRGSNSLIQMDGEEHALYRGLTAGWFNPGNIRRLEGRIREIARGLVDHMANSGGRCDFVNDVAIHFSLLVIMEILGLPEEDELLMLALSQSLIGTSDPHDVAPDGKPPERDRSAMSEMVAYFNRLTEVRRARPTSDVASMIANSRIDGKLIDPVKVMGYYLVLITAGHDTTSSAASGGMWALAQGPGQYARVRTEAALMGPLIDEAIRWTTPVKHFMRTAMADTVVGDQEIARGEWLMLCYASANRDETIFPDPDAFRVDRKPNRHIAFGFGNHLCLGQYLARMEMRILFEELLPRIKTIELDGQPRMSVANVVSGPLYLPVRYTMG